MNFLAPQMVETPEAAALQPVRRTYYQPGLDALRFFAFLSVFIHHTLNSSTSGALMKYGSLARLVPLMRDACGFGLCLFFFLSAYLITALLEVEKAKIGRIDLRKFYIRRMLRIWPLYVAYLAGIWIVGQFWRPLHFSPLFLLALLGMVGNWFMGTFRGGNDAVGHLWSISVEEQFYVLWPTICSFFSARRLQAACLVFSGLSLLSIWILASYRMPTSALWFNSVCQSLFFALGALLAIRTASMQRASSLWRACLAIGGGFALWLLGESVGHVAEVLVLVSPLRLTVGYLLVAAACALLVQGFLRLPHRYLPEPLRYLGRISYGLYVFHAIVIVTLRHFVAPRVTLPGGSTMAVTLLVTIALAALSYEFLEKPFLRLKSRFELVKTRVI